MEIKVEIEKQLIEERNQLERDLKYERQRNADLVRILESTRRLLAKRETFIKEKLMNKDEGK